MYLFYCDSMKVVNNLNPNEANSKCSDSTIHFMEVEPPSLQIVHSIRAVQFILVLYWKPPYTEQLLMFTYLNYFIGLNPAEHPSY